MSKVHEVASKPKHTIANRGIMKV